MIQIQLTVIDALFTVLCDGQAIGEIEEKNGRWSSRDLNNQIRTHQNKDVAVEFLRIRYSERIKHDTNQTKLL